MSAHTPRPWVTGCWKGLNVYDAHGELVAEIAPGIPLNEAREVSRLIAAAPELLETLKDALKVVRCPCPTAEAAIAKAEGK